MWGVHRSGCMSLLGNGKVAIVMPESTVKKAFEKDVLVPWLRCSGFILSKNDSTSFSGVI